MSRYKAHRAFLKTDLSVLKEHKTDCQLKVPQPPLVKAYSEHGTIIDLPKVTGDILTKPNIYACLSDRRSVRRFSETALTLAELGYLLWSTQGIQRIIGNNAATWRPVPCSGATHSFETYLLVSRVEGLRKGIYRYLPLEHKLLYQGGLDAVEQALDEATPNQPFVPHFTAKAAVAVAWSCIPYRAEWKFDLTAHKKILIDVGHVCQNLYLAGEALDCGVCAIGIYDQDRIDQLFALDGEDEFVIYMAVVGKK